MAFSSDLVPLDTTGEIVLEQQNLLLAPHTYGFAMVTTRNYGLITAHG